MCIAPDMCRKIKWKISWKNINYAQQNGNQMKSQQEKSKAFTENLNYLKRFEALRNFKFKWH